MPPGPETLVDRRFIPNYETQLLYNLFLLSARVVALAPYSGPMQSTASNQWFHT